MYVAVKWMLALEYVYRNSILVMLVSYETTVVLTSIVKNTKIY